MRLVVASPDHKLKFFSTYKVGMTAFNPAVLLHFILISLVSGLQFPNSPFSQVPFLTVWNAPTANCLSDCGIDLDLGIFNIVQNKNQTFMGQNITIFYAEKLGLYPRYSPQREAVNGGVPQNSSLEQHLRVARDNINTYIPDRDFQGMAVVDWESWRPLWERNWDSKQIYQEGSRVLVRSKHPDWSPKQVDSAARLEFGEAGRNFMAETLKLGQAARPHGLWGYYGFPNCYNYYSENSTGYTGECPAVELKRNDKLLWLWRTSSALFPDIYLSVLMRSLRREVLLYSRYRILEALRVGDQVTPLVPPVYTYARIVYTFTLDFLSQEHLVYTVGESAALGSAGVILWGDHGLSKSQATCKAVKSYIDSTLGPYLVNITAAATLCSQAMCSSHGRCQRRDPHSRAYLHLDPASWKVVSESKPGGGRNYRVLGQELPHHMKLMKSEFQCRCYTGWRGERCSEPAQV